MTAPAKARAALSEQQIHMTVTRWLDLALPKGAVFFHVPNGGSRNVIEATKLKRMGTKAGVPDFCVIYRGRSIFIELKANKGRLSPAQTDMLEQLTLAGAVTTVCRSLEEVSAFLGQLMPLRVGA